MQEKKGISEKRTSAAGEQMRRANRNYRVFMWTRMNKGNLTRRGKGIARRPGGGSRRDGSNRRCVACNKNSLKCENYEECVTGKSASGRRPPRRVQRILREEWVARRQNCAQKSASRAGRRQAVKREVRNWRTSASGRNGVAPVRNRGAT